MMRNCTRFALELFRFASYYFATTVSLVMDRVAKRPRGFAFLSYSEEDEASGAMEGMHGKVKDFQSVRCLCCVIYVDLVVSAETCMLCSSHTIFCSSWMAE